MSTDRTIHYTSNDEVRQEFSIVLTARAISGQPTPSNESSVVEWAEVSDLDRYTMHASMRARVERYLAGPDTWPQLA